MAPARKALMARPPSRPGGDPLLTIEGEALRVEEVVRVARAGEPVTLSRVALRRISASRAALVRIVESGHPAYGVNTGFGQLENTPVTKADLLRLQENLVRSHAAGAGPPLWEDDVRASMLIRANALAKGYSGVRPEVVELLLGMLNRGVHPVVPSRGSLGASGDLAPLAHIALVRMGGGEARKGEKRILGGAALRAAGLRPLRLEAKEGLAILNGTAVMAGLGCLLVSDALQLLKDAEIAASVSFEALRGSPAPFDARLSRLKKQVGQQLVAGNKVKLLHDSEIVKSHQGTPPRPDPQPPPVPQGAGGAPTGDSAPPTPRGRPRAREQGVPPPRLRGLHPRSREPRGPQLDGAGGGLEGPPHPGECPAGRRDRVPVRCPGSRVPQALEGGARPAVRPPTDPEIDPPPHCGPVDVGRDRSGRGDDAGRRHREGRGGPGGPARLADVERELPLLVRGLEGPEADGAPADAGRAQLVGVPPARPPRDREALLDLPLADRAPALVLRDELLLLLGSRGPGDDLDLRDHLLRVLLVVHHPVARDLDHEGDHAGGRHADPQGNPLLALRADRGEPLQALHLRVPEDLHLDVLRESLPRVPEDEGRLGPLLEPRDLHLEAPQDVGGEPLDGLPREAVRVLRGRDRPAHVRLLELDGVLERPLRLLHLDPELLRVPDRGLRLVRELVD